MRLSVPSPIPGQFVLPFRHECLDGQTSRVVVWSGHFYCYAERGMISVAYKCLNLKARSHGNATQYLPVFQPDK